MVLYSADCQTYVASHYSQALIFTLIMVAQTANVYGTATEDLTTILGYFSPYFPFTAGGSVIARRNIKVSVLAGEGGLRDHRLV